MALRTLAEALALRRQPPKKGRYGSRSADYNALLAVTSRIGSVARIPDPRDLSDLSHGEQVLKELGFVMDGEVHNGGFHQYLTNSSGDGAEAARRYLAEVGAAAHVAILDRVASVFPGDVIPTRRDERIEFLMAAESAGVEAVDRLFDAATREYHVLKEDLYTRLMDYVEAHQADFALPDDATVRAAATRR